MMILRTGLSALAALALIAGAPTDARADKEQSLKTYKKGKKKFNLGDFEDAIVLFKQAYDEYEAPAYLYNIAQAYRQLDNCPKALFFYERFLAEKPGSEQEATIEGHVAELKSQCGESGGSVGMISEVDDPRPKEDKPVETADSSTATQSESSDAQVSGAAKLVQPEGPRGPLVVATAEAGMAFFNLGEVVVPVSATLRLGAAYPIALESIDLEAGVSLILSNMAYDEAMGTSSVLFTNLLLNASASRALSSSLRVGGELGIGLFRFAGVEQGNPFTKAAAEQDAFSTLSLRFGASAEYALSEDMGLSASPAFTYAGAHEQLAGDIDSVTNLQLLGGLRYRW